MVQSPNTENWHQPLTPTHFRGVDLLRLAGDSVQSVAYTYEQIPITPNTNFWHQVKHVTYTTNTSLQR